MNNESGIFIIGIVVGLLIGLFVSSFRNDLWKAEAIQHGAAHYNTTNSYFEWNK